MRCTCSRCPTLAAVSISLVLGACGGRETTAPETMPIHLEDRLASAQIEGAEVDAETAKPIAWHFGEGPAGWKVLPSRVEGATPAEVDVATEGLRVSLKKTSFAPEKNEGLDGGVYIDVDALNIDLWSHVLIEARASAETTWIGIGYNLNESPGVEPEDQWPTAFWGSGTRLVGDGRVQTYRIPVRGEGGPITEPVRQVVIEFGAKGPAEIELLSVSLVPALATYAESGVGVRSVSSMNHQAFGPQRRTLYSHVPSRIAFPLRVPGHGRLDLALGTFGGETRLKVAIDSGSSTEVLLDESVPPLEAWRQRSLDLEKWSGQEIELVLQSEADSPGALAFWASPTVSSAKAERSSERPNVVFYVIDGASAGYMSVYGYERPTTPNLQQLAAEGVVFDRAYSNATWTMPSTASFMTSLYHSVLGGLRDDANPVPPRVPTMAEHFHDAGFHTGVFTFNPNAGALSGLDRAVDVFRDYGKRSDPFDPIEAISSQVLQGQFWEWRNAYPGPYWVHFQTTDVHP
ncbi:MAG: sulfatase-like hydrolase/transferase, partial [Thermoanaerobaculia bacterium]|nr:sulfatase-like hydrolase/transferase [Thermoanaerobaculia bacterium]